jgi:hypothetical protein
MHSADQAEVGVLLGQKPLLLVNNYPVLVSVVLSKHVEVYR